MSEHATRETVDVERYFECVNALYHEAQLLDENRLREWLDLLTDDLTYRVPIRLTQERAKEPGFSETSYHMDDDRSSIETRVARLESAYDWSENPPSRTRRNVSNVRISPADGSGDTEEVDARSNLLLFRGKGDTTDYDLLSAERHDTLRKEAGTWRLAERIVYLDHTVVGTAALPIFL